MVLPFLVIPVIIGIAAVVGGTTATTTAVTVIKGPKAQKKKKIIKQFDIDMEQIEKIAVEEAEKTKKENGVKYSILKDMDFSTLTEEEKDSLFKMKHAKQQMMEEQLETCKNLYITLCKKQEKKGHDERLKEYENELDKLKNILVEYLVSYEL